MKHLLKINGMFSLLLQVWSEYTLELTLIRTTGAREAWSNQYCNVVLWNPHSFGTELGLVFFLLCLKQPTVSVGEHNFDCKFG
jgi:hypothetical protein